MQGFQNPFFFPPRDLMHWAKFLILFPAYMILFEEGDLIPFQYFRIFKYFYVVQFHNL